MAWPSVAVRPRRYATSPATSRRSDRCVFHDHTPLGRQSTDRVQSYGRRRARRLDCERVMFDWTVAF